MAVLFEGTINVEKYLDKIINVIWGTLSSKLILAGISFLTFGLWDVFIFAWETKVLGRNVTPPGGDIGWSEVLGLSLLVLGIVIGGIKSCISFFSARTEKLSERKMNLLENFSDMSNTRLQEELQTVFGIRNADTNVSRRVLNHKTNQMGAITHFKKCHLNVECSPNDWLSLKGLYFKPRYYIGWFIWWSLPILILLSLSLASMESVSPGVSASGKYAMEAYLFISALVLISAYYTFGDLKKMGSAISLVEELIPSTNNSANSANNSDAFRARDLKALNWILSSIHIPTIEGFLDDAPRKISSRAIHFWEGFDSIYQNALFNLYDEKSKKVIGEIQKYWQVSLAFSHRYRPNSDGSIHIFDNVGDAPLTTEQEHDWVQIESSVKEMKVKFAELLSIIRDKYPEIDIMHTNSLAWKEYTELEEKFSELANSSD